MLQHFAIKLRSGVVRTLSKTCYGVFFKHEWLFTQKIHWITSAVNIFSYMESLSITYSFADSEKAPVHVSDRLIFCCGNLILHQIEKWKWLKDKIYDEKHQKKMPKSGWKHYVEYLFWTRPADRWCNMLQTLERRRNKEWYHFVRRTLPSVIPLQCFLTTIKIKN